MTEPTEYRCQGKTKKGKKCQRTVSKDKSYCHLHQPSEDEILIDLDDVCPICLEGGEMFTLNCNHKVHLDCIKNVADSGCVLCRAPMTNLPKEIEDKILENERIYKNELEEEDRNLARQTQRTIGINNLFSIYIRPRPQIELKYAMFYLKSQGIPLKYLPEKIKILVPQGHPNPPPGVLFTLLVSQTLERMKEDMSNIFLNTNFCDHDSDSESDEYPFEDEDEELRYIRRLIERISVNPETFNPLNET
jgi:hypothetical protein